MKRTVSHTARDWSHAGTLSLSRQIRNEDGALYGDITVTLTPEIPSSEKRKKHPDPPVTLIIPIATLKSLVNSV